MGLTVRSNLTKPVVAVASMAGLIGIGMTVAGVHSALRAILVLLFLAIVPTAAIAGLLHSFDLFARIILALAANITILTLTSLIMLAEGVRSPVAGLLAVAGVSAVLLVAQWTPARRRVRTGVTAWRAAVRTRTTTRLVDK
jgi:uncharacterized membrane protein